MQSILKTLRGLLVTFAAAVLTTAAAGQHGHHRHGKPAATKAAVPVVSASFDPTGRLWRVRMRDGHVLVSHSSDLGRSYSSEVKVNAEPQRFWADGENRPRVVSDGRGRVYVSYTQMLDEPMAGHIRFARSTDGGKAFSEPVVVNDHREPVSHRFQAMGMNRQGQVSLAWLDKRDQAAARQAGQPYTGAALYYTRTDDGVNFEPNVKLADHTCECCRVAMAVGPDGRPVVFWRHVFEPNVRDHAFAWLDMEGGIRRVSHDEWRLDGCPHHGPAMSISEDGTQHFAWFTGGPEEARLGYTRSVDGGRSFASTVHFGDPQAQPGRPDVLSVERQVYLVWKQFDGNETSVLVQRSGDAGRTWGPPRVVASAAGTPDHPALLAHGKRVYLSWSAEGYGHRLTPLNDEVVR